MKSSKTYNDFIIGSVCKQIQKEMKSSGPIFNIDSRNKTKSFESYSWKTANKSLKNKCPTLMTILGSTVERKLSKKDDVRLTMIAAQLFFVRCPAKHKVLQELIGLLLWFAGTNRKTFQRLNRLGISSGIKATTKTIDALRSEFDVTIHQQRQRITELQSTSRKAKRELFSDEWEDLTEWVKVLDVTDTPMDHCDDSHVVVSQTDTVLDVTDTPMDHCDDSHVVVSQTDTVIDVTDTPMDHCDDSHVVVSQTDTVLDVTDNPTDHCDDSHVVVSQTDTGEEAPDTPLSQWPVDQSPNPDNNGGSCPNLDETILYGQTDDTTATPLGFTLTFDNVNQRTRTSFHSSEGKANRQFNLVQSYGEIDRVPCFHLSDEPPSLEQLSSIC
eukprot:XP_011671222.1 PREDICTED: uncharacterized protein LOC100893591 [Strongylocentrotus purpuratus]